MKNYQFSMKNYLEMIIAICPKCGEIFVAKTAKRVRYMLREHWENECEG